MRRSSCLLIGLLITVLLIAAARLTPLSALPVQPILPPARPPVRTPVSPWLALNRRAGMIFAGKVLRVQRVPAQNLRDLETVEISFHVETAIRGVRTGQTLSIREWAGLWVAQPRYRVGEREVLFLYPPSQLGLTSPVADGRGRFLVSPGRRVRFSPAQRSWLETEDPSLPDGIPLTNFLQKVRTLEGEQP
jgi:hypothetical protein